MSEPLLNEKQAAAFLQVTTRSLQRWRQENRGPRYRKFDKMIRYSKADLEAYDVEHIVETKQVG